MNQNVFNRLIASCSEHGRDLSAQHIEFMRDDRCPFCKRWYPGVKYIHSDGSSPSARSFAKMWNWDTKTIAECKKCKESWNVFGVANDNQSPVNQEWEYYTVENMAPKGKCIDYVVGAERISEASARLTFWYKYKAEIMETVQPLIDDGWQSTTDIDPGCLIITTSAEHSKGILQTVFNASIGGYNWWLIGVQIKFRRRKS